MVAKRARRSPDKSQGDTASAASRGSPEAYDNAESITQGLTAGESSSNSTIAASLGDEEDADIAKILIATDNHVGYMERDPIRGLDSINTFREILQIARDRNVDFILLGGDLFHENRPSRTTLYQVIGALREFTFGDKPVSVELLSDPNDGQAEGYPFPAVNYEDPNINVAIPVFSIHGNHDDPQGVGAEGALSAVDLLSMSGLLNYFGKVELPTADEAAGRGATEAPAKGGHSDIGIRIRPVLLRKGDTKIALYGMGNIKDERMHFELRANRVRMYRPCETPDEWFNILTIHQNRAAHNPKAVVPETMFDDSVHLVVWGHEHEQLITPSAVAGRPYRICQPGSSVATSLCPGEAVEKKVAILHVKGQESRMEQISLRTVRPFIMEEVDLDEITEEANVRIDNKVGVSNLLARRVQTLIDRANAEWDEKYSSSSEADKPAKLLPLVRLRVHYTRHDVSNLVRFGQSFAKKVANPRDLLQFAKKKGEAGSRKRSDRLDALADAGDEMIPAEKLEKVRMEDLVHSYLSKQPLQILNRQSLERAVMQFVDKDDRDAIGHLVSKELQHTNAGLATEIVDEKGLADGLDRIRMERSKDTGDTNEIDEDVEAGGDGEVAVEQQPPPRARRSSLDNSFDSDDSMLNDDVFAETQPRAASRRGASSAGGAGHKRIAALPKYPRSRAGGGTQGALTFRGDSDDEEEQDGAEAQSSQPAPPLSSRAAALARSAPAGKKAASRGATAKKTTTPRKNAPTMTSTTRTISSARETGARAAARKANSRLVESQAGEEDEREDGERDVIMDEDEWLEE